ncbi:MAG: hypothetical protein ACTHJN_18490, partial [Ginsengibacter sp.]
MAVILTMRNLTCFIASAFGYPDVDSIFDKTLKVLFKELKIKPLRVDRINHNDKIDKKIIELIEECDFGIVDLTYARPSAYFEAGYVEGLGKKVIYISRKDHFKQKDSDVLGNEKIHFDLVTKNIIGWTAPNETFKKFLKARVSLVTRPIIQKRKKSSDEVDSRKQFESLSLSDRVKQINQVAIAFLTKNKFKLITGDRFSNNTFKKNGILAKVEVYDTITKDDLFYFHFRDSKNLYKPQRFYRIFCSLKSTPKSRVEKALRL